MLKNTAQKITVAFLPVFLLSSTLSVCSQTTARNAVFGEMELLNQTNEKIREIGFIF